jgi:hypothetical protein
MLIVNKTAVPYCKLKVHINETGFGVLTPGSGCSLGSLISMKMEATVSYRMW